MKLDIRIITKYEDLELEKFSRVWRLLNNDFINPIKYDSKEPVKRTYNESAFEDAFNLLLDYEMLIVYGKKKTSITVMPWDSIVEWGFKIDLDPNESNIGQIIKILLEFDSYNPIIYGRLTENKEHDHKHKMVKESSYGWRGVASRDFFNFLPGIYWLNIFGKELLSSLEDFNSSIEGLNKINLKSGGIIFYLKQEMNDMNLGIRIEEENRIKKKIGEQFFFEKDNMMNNPSHPKEFIKFLNDLES